MENSFSPKQAMQVASRNPLGDASGIANLATKSHSTVQKSAVLAREHQAKENVASRLQEHSKAKDDASSLQLSSRKAETEGFCKAKQESDANAIQIHIRVKPIGEEQVDAFKEGKGMVGQDENGMSVLEVYPLSNDRGHSSVRNCRAHTVQPPTSNQGTVYSQTALNVTKNVVENGLNGSIIAYGQTGSGKTHTILGDLSHQEEQGIIPRALDTIFQGLARQKEETEAYFRQHPARLPDDVDPEQYGQPFQARVYISYVEIYNECVFDLLVNSPHLSESERSPLKLREVDGGNGFYLEGATQIPIESTAQALSLLSVGFQLRRTCTTNMNTRSSRSHAILTVTIEVQQWVHDVHSRLLQSAKGDAAGTTRDDTAEQETTMDGTIIDTVESLPTVRIQVRKSTLDIVDLAGSERQRDTGSGGRVLKEAGKINNSLGVLIKTVHALSDAQQAPHNKPACLPPWRDSKLTMLLKRSLSGNSKTSMIFTVSPAMDHWNETLSTLSFANRAGVLKTAATSNITHVVLGNNNENSSLTIFELQKQVKQLRAKVRHLEDAKKSRTLGTRGSSIKKPSVFKQKSGDTVHLNTAREAMSMDIEDVCASENTEWDMEGKQSRKRTREPLPSSRKMKRSKSTSKVLSSIPRIQLKTKLRTRKAPGLNGGTAGRLIEPKRPQIDGLQVIFDEMKRKSRDSTWAAAFQHLTGSTSFPIDTDEDVNWPFVSDFLQSIESSCKDVFSSSIPEFGARVSEFANALDRMEARTTEKFTCLQSMADESLFETFLSTLTKLIQSKNSLASTSSAAPSPIPETNEVDYLTPRPDTADATGIAEDNVETNGAVDAVQNSEVFNNTKESSTLVNEPEDNSTSEKAELIEETIQKSTEEAISVIQDKVGENVEFDNEDLQSDFHASENTMNISHMTQDDITLGVVMLEGETERPQVELSTELLQCESFKTAMKEAFSTTTASWALEVNELHEMSKKTSSFWREMLEFMIRENSEWKEMICDSVAFASYLPSIFSWMVRAVVHSTDVYHSQKREMSIESTRMNSIIQEKTSKVEELTKLLNSARAELEGKKLALQAKSRATTFNPKVTDDSVLYHTTSACSSLLSTSMAEHHTAPPSTSKAPAAFSILPHTPPSLLKHRTTLEAKLSIGTHGESLLRKMGVDDTEFMIYSSKKPNPHNPENPTSCFSASKTVQPTIAPRKARLALDSSILSIASNLFDTSLFLQTSFSAKNNEDNAREKVGTDADLDEEFNSLLQEEQQSRSYDDAETAEDSVDANAASPRTTVSAHAGSVFSLEMTIDQRQEDGTESSFSTEGHKSTASNDAVRETAMRSTTTFNVFDAEAISDADTSQARLAESIRQSRIQKLPFRATRVRTKPVPQQPAVLVTDALAEGKSQNPFQQAFVRGAMALKDVQLPRVQITDLSELSAAALNQVQERLRVESKAKEAREIAIRAILSNGKLRKEDKEGCRESMADKDDMDISQQKMKPTCIGLNAQDNQYSIPMTTGSPVTFDDASRNFVYEEREHNVNSVLGALDEDLYQTMKRSCDYCVQADVSCGHKMLRCSMSYRPSDISEAASSTISIGSSISEKYERSLREFAGRREEDPLIDEETEMGEQGQDLAAFAFAEAASGRHEWEETCAGKGVGAGMMDEDAEEALTTTTGEPANRTGVRNSIESTGRLENALSQASGNINFERTAVPDTSFTFGELEMSVLPVIGPEESANEAALTLSVQALVNEEETKRNKGQECQIKYPPSLDSLMAAPLEPSNLPSFELKPKQTLRMLIKRT